MNKKQLLFDRVFSERAAKYMSVSNGELPDMSKCDTILVGALI